MSLYFIALLPPEELREQIKELKLDMAARFSARHALKLPAHITLQPPFKWKPEQEEILTGALNELCLEQPKFPVVLDGFGSFPPRVIFINIKNKEPVVELYERLQKKMSTLTTEAGSRRSGFQAHITLATRDLEKVVFPAAREYLSQQSFIASFEARSISLLKHNGKRWVVNKDFKFKND